MLKIQKFKDSELQLMCSNVFEREKLDWKRIQRSKEVKEEPYFESVEPAVFSR